MLANIFLLLAMSAFSTALPTSTKQDTCSTPSSFTILQFGVFTPATGNPHSPVLAFEFEGDTFNTECSSNITSNPNTPIACDNSNVSYMWDDASHVLTIGETYTPCNTSTSALAVGGITITLDCIPSEAPNGQGTRCEDPVGDLSGQFTRSSW